MVLPAPPPHAPPVESHWLDKLVVAIELSAHGVLTLVDHAAPSQLREAYLRLRARDLAADVIVDVRQLAELPPGTTVILALTPSISTDDLDWLNLNRPLVSDRRHNVVLWCEDDAAAVLARGAPDFFDWISARVDCPPAPAAFAVADVKAAIRARAAGIAWVGPGLDETLAAVRPGRPIRRVAVASYQSMIDALTSREPGWLFLDGVDTEFHQRRLRWAMAETGRRVIVFRRSLDRTLPGWWTVYTEHAPIVDAVHGLTAAGGTGRLAALTGLDPAAVATAVFLLLEASEAARLEDLLAATSEPGVALQNLARPLGFSLANVFADQPPQLTPSAFRSAFESEGARHTRDADPIVTTLKERRVDSEQWVKLGTTALELSDFEVAIRWLTVALSSLPDDYPLAIAVVLGQRGRAYHLAGELTSAHRDLEHAYTSALRANNVFLAAMLATLEANVLLAQGEAPRARERLESALSVSRGADDTKAAIALLDTLVVSLLAQRDLAGARQHLERSLSIKRRVFATEDHLSIASSLGTLGAILVAQGDLEGARPYLERSLEISERLGGPEHQNVVAMLRMLADIHWKIGDLPGARSRLERALAAQRAAFGSKHLDTAETLVPLARVLSTSGDLNGAQVALEDALSIQQKAFGADGQLAGTATRRELAKVLAAKGDLTAAAANLQQALATLRRIFERDDRPDVAETLRELERLETLQRDLQSAD